MQHGESAFQIAVVRFLRSLGYQVFSVPNGRVSPGAARGKVGPTRRPTT